MRVLLASIYPFAFLILYFIIPFDEYIRALPNILLGIIVVAFPFIVSKSDFQKAVKRPALLFLLFFSFLIINSLVQGRLEEDFYILKKILISVGLVLLYIPIHDFKKIEKAVIYSSLAAMIFAVVNVFLLNDISSFEFQNPLDILLIDRLYLGLLSVLSILVSYNALKPKFDPNNQFNVVNIILNVVFVFIIGSRVAIIILLAILLLRQFYGPQKKIRLLVTTAVFGIVLVLAFAFNSNGVKNYFFDTQVKIEESYGEQPSLHWEFRKIIWDCANDVRVSEGNNFFGIGFKMTNVKLVKCYDETITNPETRDWFLAKKFNSHNQFIDLYLSTGLIGLLLFLSIILVLFMQFRKHFFPVALIVTLVLFGMAENFFHRQMGAYYFGAILIILFSNGLFLQNSKEKVVK